jgi:uncharacterized protein Yka (UPF0111/DUF47 family)
MDPTNLTIEVLQGIRQDIKDLGANLGTRIDATNERIDRTNERLDGGREELSGRIEELSRRVVESEVRTSTAIADLAGTVREMTGVLRAANDLRPRVEKCEHDIADLQRGSGSRRAALARAPRPRTK